MTLATSHALVGRRAVVLGLAAAFGAPGVSGAQTSDRPRRVIIYTGTTQWKSRVLTGLVDRGWTPGQSLSIDWLVAAAGTVAEATQIREMDQRHLDVAVLAGPHRLRLAMTAAKTTPIVAVDLESDPVASGFVRSLGRPETNMSGIWLDLPELAGKQIQFLRETVPGLSRLGVLWDDRVSGPQFTAAQTAARASAIGLHAVAVHAAGEADGAMKRLLAERPQAILVLTAPAIFGGLSRIAQLSIQHRIPSISPFSNYPATGGLMAYGPDFATLWQQVAAYVDRVLRGARIGDLPVERPSKFVLIVNLKTAEASRLSMPESLVLRADEVIK